MYSIEIKNNKEIYEYCMINGITDINKFIQDCFKRGYDLKKYGLLSSTDQPQEIEKIVEVIKEVPSKPIEIEVIKYVDREVIKEVPVEKIVEVIKYVDREVTKEVPIENVDENKVKMLETTLQNLKKQLSLKDIEISDLKQKLEQVKRTEINMGALYLKNSNLNQNI